MSPKGLQHQRSLPAPHPQTYRAWSTQAPPSPGPSSISNHLHRAFSCNGQIEHPDNKPKPKLVKDGGILQVLAAQTLKIASINGLGEVDKLENDLEDEIRYENRSPAKTAVGRLRRAGQHRIHSKPVLLLVVVLNIIDCLLVISELVLDFLHVLVDREEVREMVYEFIDKMSKMYHMEGWQKPYEGGPHGSNREYLSYHFLEYVLNAFVTFKPDVTADSLRERSEECVNFLNITAESANQSLSSFVSSTASHLGPDWSGANSAGHGACFGPFIAALSNGSALPSGHDDHGSSHSAHSDHGHSGHSDGHGHDDHSSSGIHLNHHGYVGHQLLDVAHKLHYISVAILSVLVLLLIVKVFCSGKRFFKSRMQVFDGIVVLISFTLDLVFIEGLATLRLEEFIIIIAFLLPWRILRVLNSLIAAVLDQQRLNLKIIYKQKKKISRTLSETTTKMEVMQRHIEVLQALCSSRGLSVVNGEIVGTRNNASKPSKPSGKDSDKSHQTSHKHRSSSGGGGGLGGLAGMMSLGKLAFQAADALAPISNGYSHGSGNNNNNSNGGVSNDSGGGSDSKRTSLANGHAGGAPLSSSDNVLNAGDHPNHEVGSELTPVGHIKAESDSELFALEHELQQQQGHQSTNDKDIESGTDGDASTRHSEATISVESEDGSIRKQPNISLEDTPSPNCPSPKSNRRRSSEILASPSTLEADLDSVRLEVPESLPLPDVGFTAPGQSSSQPSASSPSEPPLDSIPNNTTTASTTADPSAPPESPVLENKTKQDIDEDNINESDAVSKL